MLQTKLEEWMKLGEWLKQWHNGKHNNEGEGKVTRLSEREWSIRVL